LTLETADVTLDEDYAACHAEVSAGDYAMIAITDTGEGIPESVKPHLFEPFFTTKPAGKGAGLGLAMCYGIVKQSGGHIGIYSESGHGATFKIYLPRVAAPAVERAPEPAAADRSPATVGGTETILLVEDDDALREAAGIVLQKLGYNVHDAANGREAIEIAGQLSHVDLLLTDVVMPRMNGKDLADQLLALRPKMKVLFTSAYTQEAIVHHGILDAGIDFLHKPYTPTTLARKAREVLGGAESAG
jgi:CheY-like chemotaxis protein